MKKKEIKRQLKAVLSAIEAQGGAVKKGIGRRLLIEFDNSRIESLQSKVRFNESLRDRTQSNLNECRKALQRERDAKNAVILSDEKTETRARKLIQALESRGHLVRFLDDETLEVSTPMHHGIMSEENIANLRDKNNNLTEEVKKLGEYAETSRELLHQKTDVQQSEDVLILQKCNERQASTIRSLIASIEAVGGTVEMGNDPLVDFKTPVNIMSFSKALYANAERVKELGQRIAILEQENTTLTLSLCKGEYRKEALLAAGYKEIQAPDLLREFWQKSSNSCPLECTEAEEQEADFKSWVMSLNKVNGHFFQYIKQ